MARPERQLSITTRQATVWKQAKPWSHWSHSALEQFKNCPRQYHAERVEKSVPYVEGPEAAYGNDGPQAVRGAGARRQAAARRSAGARALPRRLAALPGKIYVEREIALNRQLQPCGYWDADVWYRAKIDYLNINNGRARIVDYKTGKPHQKILQLFEYILSSSSPSRGADRLRGVLLDQDPVVTGTGGSWPRERMNEMWPMLLPDLKQMAEAFQDRHWQPRQSGLCKRHCPVVDCEFNGAYGGVTMRRPTPRKRTSRTTSRRSSTSFGWFWFMPPANAYGKSGISDIIALKRGTFMAIETKFGSNKPTAMQIGFLNSVRASDGFAFVVNEKNLPWLERSWRASTSRRRSPRCKGEKVPRSTARG
jgi:hypothetical protein